MPLAETRTPFGVVRFDVKGVALEVAPFAWFSVGAGPGVDAQVASIYFIANAGEEIEIELTSEINEGFDVALLIQDGIEAYEISNRTLVAAFGMRNGLWMDAQPGLSLLAFEGGLGRAHYVIKSNEATVTEFTAAVAWTSNPPTDAEDAAPREAVAKMLSA